MARTARKPRKTLPVRPVRSPSPASGFTKLPNIMGSATGVPSSNPAAAVGTPAPPKPNYSLSNVPLNHSQLGQISQVEAEYNANTAGLDHSIYEAALRYGDPNLVKQFAGAKYPVVDNPYGQLQTIEKNKNTAKENVGKNLNKKNAFFSGLHLNEIGKVNDEASRQLTEAELQFKSAQQRYFQAKADEEARKQAAMGQIKGSAMDQLLAEWMNRYG